MKHIVAINTSPRSGWNTDTLVREAARGAESAGAQVTVIDLYKLDKFCGCMSCFACKTEANYGKCVYPDALAPVLEQIRQADGLILGAPNYLGDVSAGCRALYERLIFQSLTYRKELPCCNEHKMPVLFIMTSNASEEYYTPDGYGAMIKRYESNLRTFVGPTKTMIYGNTLQVHDYSRYNWTMFDPEAKKARHEEVFPLEKEKAFQLGKELCGEAWV